MGLPSIYSVASEWLRGGEQVVAATLVDTDGSTPLDPGAAMLVSEAGRIEGSVTGGCVEGALVEEAQDVFDGGEPRIRTYGISDTQAADVGLMCGGTVHVFVSEVQPTTEPLLKAVADAEADGRPAAIATVLSGEAAGRTVALVDEELHGELGDTRLENAIRRDAEGCLAHGVSTMRAYGRRGEVMGQDIQVFVHAIAPPARLVIFGAVDFSAAVALFAKHLGYQVQICDARKPFLTSSRFSYADGVVVDWPDRYLQSTELDRRDAILVFTHDPKFDEPALIAALESGAGYIGALGSRKTHEDRRRRLLEAGVEKRELERISAPCGLDIGARTPEETAISVLAEIIGSSTGRYGEPLSATAGSIHPPPRRPAALS